MKYVVMTWSALAAVAAGCATPRDIPPVRHTVVADGHPIAVWSKHPVVSRGSVVLLHGRTWSALPDFDLQVPGEELSLMDGLVDRDYATYAVDMRGYGSTPRDGTGWLTPNRAADDIIAVLEWMRDSTEVAGRPVLFGWSLGSMVAQLAVQQRPDLVSSVVLFGYPFDVGSEIPADDDTGDPPRAATTREAAASDFIIEGSISRAAITAYVDAAVAADPVRVDWNRSHEWMALDPEAVTVPTLLLQAEFDPLAPTERQAALFTKLGTPVRQWVVIPGGDHAAFLETPREYFLSATTAFIERTRAN